MGAISVSYKVTFCGDHTIGLLASTRVSFFAFLYLFWHLLSNQDIGLHAKHRTYAGEDGR